MTTPRAGDCGPEAPSTRDDPGPSSTSDPGPSTAGPSTAPSTASPADAVFGVNPDDKFHGQLRQDELAYNLLFRGGGAGVYLEVGASDGVTFSNTLFFDLEMGWRGMCVEANPDDFEHLARNRPNATCVFGAAADRNGVVGFRVNTGYARQLSGIEDAYHPHHRLVMDEMTRVHGGDSRLVDVPCFRLQDLLDDQGVTVVDWMSLDVEGGELAALRGLDLDKTHVRLMTVEDNYGLEPELDALLVPKGYAKLGRVGHNVVYHKPLPGEPAIDRDAFCRQVVKLWRGSACSSL